MGAWLHEFTGGGTYIGSWLDLAMLWLLPFLHEDFAVVLGAYKISSGELSIGLVAAALYAGIVVSDLALYAVGAIARRSPGLGRWAGIHRINGVGGEILSRVYWLMAICRVVPGVTFIAFVACGWIGVSFRRFVMASLVVSGIYLPIMLAITIGFGNKATPVIGQWSWALLIAAMIGLFTLRRRLIGSDWLLAKVVGPPMPREPVMAQLGGHLNSSAFRSPAQVIGQISGRAPETGGAAAHAAVAAAERIPPAIFYAPLVANWFFAGARHGSLTLPACANPMIPTGGMWGESKSDCLAQIAPTEQKWVADFAVMRRGTGISSINHDLALALGLIADRGIAFPLVAKPDIGWHGYGVRVVRDQEQLAEYLEAYPAQEQLILQKLATHSNEAAVLYSRLPGQSTGRIESLTRRQLPCVVGDGVTTLAELIDRDPRAHWKARQHCGLDKSHCGLRREERNRIPDSGEIVQLAFVGNQRLGGIYHDITRTVTPALEARFDEICRGMPEFHYGRFDVRYASDARLAEGEDFLILEINGIGGEAIDAWDPDLSISETYRRLFRQQSLLFEIGARNRARGFKPPGGREFLGPLIAQTRLIGRYPPSE